MGYYDNVKENVKKQAADSSSGSSSGASGGGNFETLKKAASETEPEKEKGDDTPIEVLEEDGLQKNPKREKKSSNSRSKDKENSKGSSESSSSNPFKDKNSGDNGGGQRVEADLSGVEDKLDTIIEQNQELIEILRSFTE
jgi:hypothetical protein